MEFELNTNDIMRQLVQDQIDKGLFNPVFLENCRAVLYQSLGVINA